MKTLQRWNWTDIGPVAILAIVAGIGPVHAIGSASTKFQVFVPPSDRVSRHTALIITAIASSGTTVDVTDDASDGDSDDSQLGQLLQRGQSLIIYMSDGATNDDFGGKSDGDYFVVDADRPVTVQMATSSNWQHDWAPSTNGTSIGHNFFIWASPSSGAENDINVFAYEDDTDVTIVRLSTAPQTVSGTTSVDLDSQDLLLAIELDAGHDLTFVNGLGQDALVQGQTYWVKSTKPITVQYGHLNGSTMAGGGFIPSSNGSSTGDLLYFSIPSGAGQEDLRELRLVSYDDGAEVVLSGYDPAQQTYVEIGRQMLDAYETADYVGAVSSTFASYDVYRLDVTAGKRVTAFEANWLETGAPGTSDFASALSSSNGLGAGRSFVAYIGPPGDETHASLPGLSPGHYSHLFVSAFYDSTSVTVTDLETGGLLYNQTVALSANDYHDFSVDQSSFDSLTAFGRPYLLVTSNEPVSVTNTNFNDNWMNFFTSGLKPDPRVSISSDQTEVSCGQTARITVHASNQESGALTDMIVDATVPDGLTWVPGSAAATGPVFFDAGTAQPNPDGSTNVRFTGTGNLAQLDEVTVSFDVYLDCSLTTGCFTGGLADLTAEVFGDFNGQLHGGIAAFVIPLTVDNTNRLSSAGAQFVADNGGVVVSWTIDDEDGRADYTVTRAMSATGSENVIASVTGTDSPLPISPYSVVDAELSTQTYYYRVSSEVNGCTSTLGPYPVTIGSNQWCVPGEISPVGSSATTFVNETRLDWPDTSFSCSTDYVVYRGDVALLSTGDFGSCAVNGLSASRWDDPAQPAPGQGWSYLVGAESAAGRGNVGMSSAGAARPMPLACQP